MELFLFGNLLNCSCLGKNQTHQENHDFLDEFDFLLGILIPDEAHDDFVISYLNKELKKYYTFNTDNVVGSYLFESMTFLNELNIKELLFDSFNNDEPLEFKVLRYIEDVLVSYDIYKFFRFKDKLYFQLNKSNDLDILNKSSKETIENSKVSVGIVQENQWVYGNKTFCKMHDVKLEDISNLPLFNKNIIKREKVSQNELKYVLSDVLNRKQFFFQDNIQLNKEEETLYISEFIYPTSFNNEPAIEVIFLDLTEEKKIENEFEELNKKLEAILKLGKLAVCKIENGRIYWSKEIFSIFGIAPEKLNLDKTVNTIEEFFYIIDNFLLKSDLISLNMENSNLNDNLDISENSKGAGVFDSGFEGVFGSDSEGVFGSISKDKNSNSSNLKFTNINLDSLDSDLVSKTDLNSRNSNLRESDKDSFPDFGFENHGFNNKSSVYWAPIKSKSSDLNLEDSIELDFLNIYDKFDKKNNKLDKPVDFDFSNIYDELSKQKSESNNINIKFGIKTKKDNIKIINCDFIIYSENPLNLTGYAQDITYEESLNNEFKQQLANYDKLYEELYDYKINLESELDKKYEILQETYFNINHNLDLFMYLLSSYLSKNSDNLDNYYKIIQKRLEILFFNSKLHQKFEKGNEIEFKEFISNLVYYAFKDLLESTNIEIDVDEGIFIKRNEIDLLYLILCEFLLNSIDLDENSFVNLIFKVKEDKKHICLDIEGKLLNKVDIDCLDLLKFVKRFKSTRLEDISIEADDKKVKMLVMFENK